MSPGPDPSTLPTASGPTNVGREGGDPSHQGSPIHSAYVVSNPRNSMSITNTKGLLNMPGQNNCFLNSAVQVLWHLDIFRRSFRELNGHACMAESCIFCALKELFAQFQYSQESALPPDALRRALAETFCDQRRFQLGFMDDAAECFENILLRIHFHIANKESEDMCTASHCIPHQKFAMTLVEQTVCHSCGATSEPLPFTQMVHYVPSSTLCSQAKYLRCEKKEFVGFGELLKKAGGLGDLRDCPSSCGALIQIRKTLMNRPEIVSIGLVWDSERPTINHIMDVFSTIGMTLKLQDVFHSVVDSRWASSANHQLVGIVTYYGKHYSTFFFHTKLRVWIYFDDAAVREIGPKWQQVVEKCCRGHFQPLLLLYANPNGTSVSTSTAPHGVTVVQRGKKSFNGDNFLNIKVSDKIRQNLYHHPVENQRRAITPNPEVSCDVNANIVPRRAVTPNGEIAYFTDGIKNSSKRENVSRFMSSSQTSGIPSHNTYDKIPGIPNCSSYNHELIKSNCFGSSSTNVIEAKDSNFQTPAHNSQSLLPPKHLHKSNFSVPVLEAKQTETGEISSQHWSYKVPNSEDTKVSQKQRDSSSMSDDVFDDQNNAGYTYISRKAVENVLHMQKLQKQRSVNAKHEHLCLGQRNSNSSLESLENTYVIQDRGLSNFLGIKSDIIDSINMPRRRDSGNWSGDRNSASSSSTTSLDNPYFYGVGNKRPYFNGRIIGRPSVADSVTSTDPGYDSFSLSSSDSYPSMMTIPPAKGDSRLGQILENQQTAFLPFDISQLEHSIQHLNKSESQNFAFRDECEKLCIEADIFLAKSVERENIGDLSMAALLSDSAAAKARAAMDVPYSSPHSLSLAKLKHSMCIIRSCNLHKKIKEMITQQWKQKTLETCKNQETSHSSCELNFSKKLSTDDNHASSKNQVKSNTNHKHPKHDSSNKAIEIYATLPKKSLRKKNGLLSFVDALTGDDSASEKSKNLSVEKTKRLSCQKDGMNGQVNANFHCQSSVSVNSKKSPESMCKAQNVHKTTLNKDSDLSDYSSEWEHTQKISLHRTYSSPPLHSKVLSGDSTDEGQVYSGQSSKKQHKIRRKLMGGFMRRKNRSLPDLRENKDQTNNGISRSIDDCAITQASKCQNNVSDKNTDQIQYEAYDKKPNKLPTPESYSKSPSVNPDVFNGQGSFCACGHASTNAKSHPTEKQNSDCTSSPQYPHSRSSTPAALSDIQNKNLSLGHKDVYNRNLPTRSQVQDLYSYTSEGHMQTQKSFSEKDKTIAYTECAIPTTNVTKQNPLPYKHVANQELPKGCAIWLKELQMKQEELLLKKKLQVERQHDCAVLSNGNVDKTTNDSAAPPLTFNGEKEHVSSVNGNSIACYPSEKNSPNTVKFLTSKFEKISKPEVGESNLVPISESQLVGQEQDSKVSTLAEAQPSAKSQAEKETLFQQRSLTPAPDRYDHPEKVTSNLSHFHVYNPAMKYIDRQQRTVMQLAKNCSGFKNGHFYHYNVSSSNNINLSMPSQKDFAMQANCRRPNKPPDYETAIQRLELIRGDRNFFKHFNFHHLPTFDSNALDHDKRKRGPKKCVTFSDKVVLVACAEEDNDFLPNPLLEKVYKQHLLQKIPSVAAGDNLSEKDQKETSSVNATQINDFIDNNNKPANLECIRNPCNLCHSKIVSLPNIYCSDCAFYMSKFQK